MGNLARFFLKRRLKSFFPADFFVYMAATLALEVNLRKEVEMLFLSGRENRGSSTRDTFRTCSIQEPPKHNASLSLLKSSACALRSWLLLMALTILAVFAPGGYNQLAKGNSGNFEAG